MRAILGSQKFSFRSNQSVQIEESQKSHHSPSGKVTPQKPPSTDKQPAQKDPVSKVQNLMSTYLFLEQMSVEHLSKVQGATPPNLGNHQLSSKNKRKSRTEMLPKVQGINFANQMSASTNNKSAHVKPSPKVQNESFESVRSKLRESLAAAFTFVSGEESKTQGTFSTEETSTQEQLIANSQVGEPSFTTGDSTKLWNCWTKEFDMKHFSVEEDMSFNNVLKDELLHENGICWVSDISFENSESNDGVDLKRPKFAQDEVTRDVKERVGRTQMLAANIEAELFRLFRGVNKKYKEKGRSLLFNLKDPNNPELREQVFSGEITPERLCSMTAEELASKQLTEWRIAKAEELAQMVVLPDSGADLRRLMKKTHKGEFHVEVERDDSVLVEATIGASAPIQVPAITSEITDILKSADTGAQNLSRSSETGGGLSEKVDSEIQHLSNVNTLPRDMPASTVGEHDAERLLPIIYFDEFVASVDSELPVENLLMAAEQRTLTGENNVHRSDSKVESVLKNSDQELNATLTSLDTKPDLKSGNFASNLDYSSDSLVSKVNNLYAGSADPLGMSAYQPSEIGSKHEDKSPGHSLGCGAVLTELDNTSIEIASGDEHIWEGLVQLNISSLATLVAFFKSGEKASTKEWPSFLEVKGRVRVDAFEKFLQELPLSRSRAVMVVHFLRKEGSPESGRTVLTQAVDSYVADDRLGYAEPAPGVELYLCPPRMKTIQMLARFVQAEHVGALASTGDGMIGVVVWRRAHVTSTLSSHHKHSTSSKRHSISKKQQRPNADLSSQPSMLAPTMEPEAQVEEDVVDVPPGFGPGAATGNEDDLPEFDFRGGSLPAPTSIPVVATGTSVVRSHSETLARPAEHTRVLIPDCGHGGEGGGSPVCMQLPMQPWDDDDDDDIPEWQPYQDNQPRRATATQPLLLQGFQQQSGWPHHSVNQHHIAAPPQHPMISRAIVPAQHHMHHEAPPPLAVSLQTIAMQGAQNVQLGACWPGALSYRGFSENGVPRPCNYGGGRVVEGQCYGRDPQIVMDWRYVPRSRGV